MNMLNTPEKRSRHPKERYHEEVESLSSMHHEGDESAHRGRRDVEQDSRCSAR